MGGNCWLQTPRHVFRIAVISSLIQGCLYLALAVWGILLYSCSITADEASIASSYFIYLVYFSNKECGSPARFPAFYAEWKDPAKNNPMAEEANTTLIVYAVVSGLWIATALLMCGALKSKGSLKASPSLYLPWVLVTLTMSLVDVYATVKFGIDFVWAKGFSEVLEKINIAPSISLPIGNDLEDLYAVPTIVLMLVSCRFIVFFFLNLYLLTRVVLIFFKSKKSVNHMHERTMDTSNRQEYPKQKLVRTTLRPDGYLHSQENLPRLAGAPHRPVTAPLTPLQAAAMQGFNYEKPSLIPVNRNTSITSKDESTLGRPSDSRGPYLPHLAPQALRNQLPWSYFRARDGPAHANAPSHELEMPPVPVPDYTLHFGRRHDRQGIERGAPETSAVSRKG